MSSLKLLRRYGTRAFGQAVAAPFVLETVSGINALSETETSLYTVPTGEEVVVIGVVLRCTAASGITTAPKAGVGIAAGADDIFTSQRCYGLLADGDEFQFPQGGIRRIADAGEEIKLGIDEAAVGTSMTLAADVLGYGAV